MPDASVYAVGEMLTYTCNAGYSIRNSDDLVTTYQGSANNFQWTIDGLTASNRPECLLGGFYSN